MGADMMGRDMLSRMIHGARISLAVALGATCIGSGLGAMLGLASGYLGGWFDLIVQRLAEIMQSCRCWSWRWSSPPRWGRRWSTPSSPSPSR